MRGFRADLLSVAAVLVVPLGFITAFPREAIGFAASRESGLPESSPVAIVFLDSTAVAKAVRAARILSKHEGGEAVAGMDLLPAELSEGDSEPMMSIDSRSRLRPPSVVEAGIPPFLPSRRAAAPARIPSVKDGDALPFPRAELLKLN